MNIFKNLKYIAKGGKTSIGKSIRWELIHAIFIGMPSGILLVVIWELFKEAPDQALIKNLVYTMGGMLILQFYFAAKSMIASNMVSCEIGATGRMKLGEHLRKLSMGFFKKRDPGDITTILLQDMDNVEWILGHSIGNLYNAIFSVIIMSCFLLYMDWRLALSLFGGILIGIPFIMLASSIVSRLGKIHKKILSQTGSRFLEYLLGIRYIKAYGMGGKKFKTLDTALKNLKRQSIRTEAIPGPFVLIPIIFLELGFLGMVSLGLYFLIGGSLSVAVLIAFLILGYRFYEPLKIITIDLIIIRYMKIGIDRVVSVLKTQPLKESVEDVTLDNFDIEFKNVSFSYLDDEVLQNISFKISEKSLTALVGPSGSGKTTITNLIARFWEVHKGDIFIGERSIKNIKQERLFSYISQVFQEVYLFNDTIYNNIKVGNKNATHEQILEAARKAQCMEFIEKLPKGFDTIAGEGGSKLSGGQKQRISIARALLKNSPIVLLDEATASLDPENELYIQKAIQQLVEDKTVIVIAHKLKTVKNADKIIVLNEGIVEECGKHDELLKKDGLYAHLWNEQQKTGGWKLNVKAKK